MNFAFAEREYVDIKFVLVSLNVECAGLRYGIKHNLPQEVNSKQSKGHDLKDMAVVDVLFL